jgi:hypothetical protein
MNIKIKKEEIFDYVVGNSNYDAIEKIIDPVRYEIFDCGIYDNKQKKMLKQSKEYEIYCAYVTNLRRDAKEMKKSEILQLCLEIEEIAPKEINLND